MKNAYIIGLVASIIVCVGSAIFDIALELGSFSGLAFLLYSAYGLAIVILSLLITAAIRKKLIWAKSAGIPLLCVVLLWIGGSLIG